MSVIIKDMTLPVSGSALCELCVKDGTVYLNVPELKPNGTTEFHDYKLSKVPTPHGRLIELMKIELACVSRDCNRDCASCNLVQDQNELINAYRSVIETISILRDTTDPTIIEAEGGA